MPVFATSKHFSVAFSFHVSVMSRALGIKHRAIDIRIKISIARHNISSDSIHFIAPPHRSRILPRESANQIYCYMTGLGLTRSCPGNMHCHYKISSRQIKKSQYVANDIYYRKKVLLLCWYFTTLRHILGHFGRGQLT